MLSHISRDMEHALVLVSGDYLMFPCNSQLKACLIKVVNIFSLYTKLLNSLLEPLRPLLQLYSIVCPFPINCKRFKNPLRVFCASFKESARPVTANGGEGVRCQRGMKQGSNLLDFQVARVEGALRNVQHDQSSHRERLLALLRASCSVHRSRHAGLVRYTAVGAVRKELSRLGAGLQDWVFFRLEQKPEQLLYVPQQPSSLLFTLWLTYRVFCAGCLTRFQIHVLLRSTFWCDSMRGTASLVYDLGTVR
ncbi:hypothetical protein VTO42DRAFT_3337 [Malbranchea cinnamomea]